MRSGAIVWVVWWAALVALYLLLVDTLARPEIVLGLLAAAAAAGAVAAVRAQGPVRFAPDPRWVLLLTRRLPINALRDTGVVFAALGRAVWRRERIEGIVRVVPFDAGGDGPRSVARRALVVAGTCVAPNTVAVAIDAAHNQLIVHQLVPTSQPPGMGDREWPL